MSWKVIFLVKPQSCREHPSWLSPPQWPPHQMHTNPGRSSFLHRLKSTVTRQVPWMLTFVMVDISDSDLQNEFKNVYRPSFIFGCIVEPQAAHFRMLTGKEDPWLLLSWLNNILRFRERKVLVCGPNDSSFTKSNHLLIEDCLKSTQKTTASSCHAKNTCTNLLLKKSANRKGTVFLRQWTSNYGQCPKRDDITRAQFVSTLLFCDL